MEDYIKFIYKAWKDFIEKGYINGVVRSDIANSWRRCKNYNVDPMGGKGKETDKANFQNIIDRNRDLISVAHSTMENLYKVVAGSGFVIMLVDKDGYVIDVIGDNEIMKRADELNFVKGFLWTEKSVGTNAIGTALYLNKPIQTIGAEHYGINQHSWTCSASPIHDKLGNIIGCINMSGNYYNAHSHTLGIVTVASQAIETQFQLTISNKLMSMTLDSLSEGMMVIDNNFKITRINNMSERVLNMDNSILGRDIKSIISNVDFQNILDNPDRFYNNITCNFSINGNITKCIINASSIKMNNKAVGIVITFRESQYYHKLVGKVIGYSANYTFEDIITDDENMKKIIELAKIAAKSDCNILIEGESGTGKELIAQSIHNYSNRKNGPFVAVNCSSIPRELVESELFGYEKGAFTGASKNGNPGKFELANDGTIFLDEIGELPIDIQSKLLRILDNNKVARVGGNYEKQLNVRVIVATNRILMDEIKNKTFRADLYYRLNVMNIRTIPLRKRKGDIELLIRYFVDKLNSKNPSQHKTVGNAYIERLKENIWIGNVRELRNIVERDYYLSDKKIFSSDYLIEDRQSFDSNEKEKLQNTIFEIVPIQVIEKNSIKDALEKCHGNMLKTAKFLNISRSTLYRKIKKYNIK
ncbi:sigma-54-dependent Fis family transcriptional regulator [Clostridium sp. LBM24168]